MVIILLQVPALSGHPRTFLSLSYHISPLMRTSERDLADSIILEELMLRTSGCCSRRVGSSPVRRQSTPAQMAVDETATLARQFLKPARDSIRQYLATMRRWETIAVLNMSHGGNDIALPGLTFSSIPLILSYRIPCFPFPLFSS